MIFINIKTAQMMLTEGGLAFPKKNILFWDVALLTTLT